MMPMTVTEFAGRCGGDSIGFEADAVLSGFALDNREVSSGDMFIAIRGARFDGHDVAEAAISAGAVGALVERRIAGPHVLVQSVVDALAQLGRSVRAEFAGPVVGVTGSNGKTATKEFVAACLGAKGKVLKSAGNRNTEFTSPLLWSELDPAVWAVVVEMAMRGPGQIAHLTSIAQPTIAIVTMVGTAHAEMVGSREGIARAKAEILQEGAAAVLWSEDDFYAFLKDHATGTVHTFGFSPESELRVLGYRPLSWNRCVVRYQWEGRTAEAELATVGRHQALNAGAAVLASVLAGVDFDSAAEQLFKAQLPPMRMEAISVHGATVLLDNYNASPDSTVAAIRTLAELPCEGKRFAVIGEMRELGEFSETGHRQVGRALAEAPFDGIMLYGNETRFIHSEAIRAGYPEFRLAEAANLHDIAAFLNQLQPKDVALIKGSRALELERALEELEVASK